MITRIPCGMIKSLFGTGYSFVVTLVALPGTGCLRNVSKLNQNHLLAFLAGNSTKQ